MREERLQADGCCSFDDFTTLMKSLVTNTMKNTRFVEAFPRGNDPENIKPPIITYKVISRIPSEKRELKPRYREAPFEDPNNQNQTISVLGQQFDYTVEFIIWGESNDQANKIAKDFEEMLATYAGDIKKTGVQELLFLSQGEDNSSTQWRDKLANRPLYYLVRLERLFIHTSQKLRLITARVNGELVFTIEE